MLQEQVEMLKLSLRSAGVPEIEVEEVERKRRNYERRLRDAQLSAVKPLAEFDWRHPQRIDQGHIQELFQLHFLRDATNVVFIGPNGVSKTMLAQNLALHACDLRRHPRRPALPPRRDRRDRRRLLPPQGGQGPPLTPLPAQQRRLRVTAPPPASGPTLLRSASPRRARRPARTCAAKLIGETCRRNVSANPRGSRPALTPGHCAGLHSTPFADLRHRTELRADLPRRRGSSWSRCPSSRSHGSRRHGSRGSDQAFTGRSGR